MSRALLRPGDTLRVVAPSRSWSTIKNTPVELESAAMAIRRLESLGLTVTFGDAIEEQDLWGAASVDRRIADLHAAFADPDVHGIITVIGGWNANQILDGLDWDLIRANPKPVCGYSDITALHGALWAKTGMPSLYGPHISTFGMRDGIEYTLQGLRTALFEPAFTLEPSAHWSDDAWFLDQDDRVHRPNPGWTVINPGDAEGIALGGHLTTLHLLQGTPYMPDLDGAVLFVEDTRGIQDFDRVLQSILHSGVRPAALLVGRSPLRAPQDPDELRRVVALRPQLRAIPVVAGLDVGHTTPHATIPIGAPARVSASGSVVTIAFG